MPRKASVLLTGDVPTSPGRSFQSRFDVHILGSLEPNWFQIHGAKVRGIAAFGKLRADRKLIAQLPALEIIANFGVGTERVDLDAARERNIVVTNTPGVLTDEVADLAIGLLLATVRRIPAAEHFLRNGKWLEGRFPLSPSLRGRRVGIVGFGRIGQAIAKRLAGFDVTIAYHSRTRMTDQHVPYHGSLTDLARWCDVLILCTPGGPSTDKMINAAVLNALGADGILINVARGSVVDQADLVAALKERRILAAGLDVFETEPCQPDDLMAFDNVVLTPHIGSSSARTWADMGDLVLANLESWFSDRRALTPVDLTI